MADSCSLMKHKKICHVIAVYVERYFLIDLYLSPPTLQGLNTHLEKTFQLINQEFSQNIFVCNVLQPYQIQRGEVLQMLEKP